MIQHNQLKSFGRRVWKEWIRPIGLWLAILLPIRSALADWNWVPSGSMKPTILEGDLVYVNKLAYDLKVPFTTHHLVEWGNPVRGDITVFFSPVDGTRLVKRVAGLPGDVVEMRQEVLYVNGQSMAYEPVSATPFKQEVYEDPQPVMARERGDIKEHYVMALPNRPALRTFGPVTVPEGCYFMLGDSRDNSNDSRFWGVVPREKITGRASRVLLSFNKNHWLIPRVSRFGESLE